MCLFKAGPVETLFSIGGKYFWLERCKLTDSVFEKLTNIKCNALVYYTDLGGIRNSYIVIY